MLKTFALPIGIGSAPILYPGMIGDPLDQLCFTGIKSFSTTSAWLLVKDDARRRLKSCGNVAVSHIWLLWQLAITGYEETRW